jgi:hypothetical protein
MHPDKDTREQFRKLFDAPVDWDSLIAAARYHRFIPLLFHSLESIPKTRVPHDVMEEVHQIFEYTVRWNMMVTSELFSLIDQLHERGISSIPFKGPLLAQVLYGDISYRQFDDLDILIQKKDFQKTKEFLIAKGYRPEQLMNPMQESVLLRTLHHFLFYNNRSGLSVEIHWEISPGIYSFNLDMAGVWHRAQPVTLSGREVITLSPADLLLILCEHGSRHYWKRLLWIADIARLAECTDIDWPLLLRHAREIGSERVLLLGMSLATTLFHAEVPHSVSQRIGNDPEVRTLTDQVLDTLYSGRGELQDLSKAGDTPDSNEELFYIRARERSSDRLRYYVRRATTPTREDLNFFVLPDILYPFYPIVRIGRLLRKYKLKIWKWM